MDLPKMTMIDDVANHIVSLMFKEIIKDNLKFNETFEVKDGDLLPKDKLDSIINDINKNLFKIEETLDKMNLSYFE